MHVDKPLKMSRSRPGRGACLLPTRGRAAHCPRRQTGKTAATCAGDRRAEPRLEMDSRSDSHGDRKLVGARLARLALLLHVLEQRGFGIGIEALLHVVTESSAPCADRRCA